MLYEFYASGKIGINGVIVPDGALVATIDTVHPLGNVLACVRLSQLTVRKTEAALPEAAVEAPLPGDKPTKVEVPTKGRFKKTK